MSVNLLVGIEQADHNNELRVMTITRFMRGITSSAYVGIGELISFPSGVQVKITQAIHSYQPASSKIAPNTMMIGVIDGLPLDDRQIALLLRDGFEDA